jgi:hypothetical protein
MHLRFLIPALLFAISVPLKAQDIYEIKFTTDDVEYKGLLVLFNESKMYMRVAYNTQNVYKVVNVDYTSEHVTDDGEEFLVLMGSNPKFITGADEYGYNPDHLVFADILETPFVIFDIEDPDNGVMADSFKPLKKGEVTDVYLRQFYRSQESDYFALRKIFGLEKKIPPPITTKTVEKPATLHLVIVANTAIGDIGSGCAVDQRNLESEFSGITTALGIGYKEYLVNGNSFTKDNVYNTLNTLTPGKNDIVVCIYRGHGFRWSNQTETWPQLDIRSSSYTRLSENTTISLSDMYNKVIGKGARLNIILADCCNNDIGLSQVTSNNFLVMQNNNNYDLAKLKSLFIESKGNLLSCAASPGEYSWVSSANGGFYTVSFLQALREEISYLRNDDADWTDITNNTITSARAKTKSCPNCTPQNGKYYNGVTQK